ncbi:hypothetical protein SKAU_G00328780, partial [Synaphobranchus kaupii]
PSQAPPTCSGGGGSSSDDTIRSILEQARRELEAQQAVLEPMLKASSIRRPASRPSPRAPPRGATNTAGTRTGPVWEAPGGTSGGAPCTRTRTDGLYRHPWLEESRSQEDTKEKPVRLPGSVPGPSSSSSSLDYWKDWPSADGETPQSSPLPSSPALLPLGKPAKVAVAPLTPEQYEVYMYQEVDTIELTQQVKDKLAKNGICQRIFGEKGAGFVSGECERHAFSAQALEQADPEGPGAPSSVCSCGSTGSWVRVCFPCRASRKRTPPRPRPAAAPAPESPLSSAEESVKSLGESVTQPPAPEPSEPSESQPGTPLPVPGHSGLSIQEMVAMSPELDTYVITKKVKEVLTDNNLGQRLFGETILGLTQGSVSDLLARPKPWHKLSLKGREPFVRMQLWLSDPRNVDKLMDMKRMEKKAYMKRRHSSVSDSQPVESGLTGSDFSQGSSPQHHQHHQHHHLKKPRVVLAPEEKEALKRAYQEKPYPLPQNHRGAGQPAQPQDQHRHQLVPQLQLMTVDVVSVSIVGPGRGSAVSCSSRRSRRLRGRAVPPSSRVAKAGEGDSCDGTESDGTVEGRPTGGPRARGVRGRLRDGRARRPQGGGGLGYADGPLPGPSTTPATASASSAPGTSGHQGGAMGSLFSFPETAPTAARNPRDSSLRKKKAANLNNIIHRLEKAASKEEPSEWGVLMTHPPLSPPLPPPGQRASSGITGLCSHGQAWHREPHEIWPHSRRLFTRGDARLTLLFPPSSQIQTHRRLEAPECPCGAWRTRGGLGGPL